MIDFCSNPERDRRSITGVALAISKTNFFYVACGFKELEVFPLYWDEANPCQVYVMSLK